MGDSQKGTVSNGGAHQHDHGLISNQTRTIYLTEDETIMTNSNPTQRRSVPYLVDGKCLVIRSGAKLPPFCVKSNEKITKPEYRQRRLKWTKEVRGRKLIMILSYFMSRQYCELTHGLASGQKTKLLLFFIGKLVLMLVGLFGMFTGAVLNWNPGVILAFCGLCILFMGLLPFGNQPLAVVREENGKFWLKGCSKEFLSRIQNQARSV